VADDLASTIVQPPGPDKAAPELPTVRRLVPDRGELELNGRGFAPVRAAIVREPALVKAVVGRNVQEFAPAGVEKESPAAAIVPIFRDRGTGPELTVAPATGQAGMTRDGSTTGRTG
jgi:hypothetical protein